MAATIIDLADRVVDVIDASPYTSITIERAYIPVNRLEDLAAPKITVVPAEKAETALTRREDEGEYAIDVAYQERIDTPTNAELDQRMATVEEIGDLFRRQSLTLNSGIVATCTSVSNRPIFDAGHLNEKRVFTSVIRLTFRLLRPV